MIDTSSESIRYMTTRTVQTDEELCIFYGHKLWFEPVESTLGVKNSVKASSEDDDVQDEWKMLQKLSLDDMDNEQINPFIEGNPRDLLEDLDMPIIHTSISPEEEDEENFLTGSSHYTIFHFCCSHFTISLSLGSGLT